MLIGKQYWEKILKTCSKRHSICGTVLIKSVTGVGFPPVIAAILFRFTAIAVLCLQQYASQSPASGSGQSVKAFHFAVFPFLRGTLFIFLQKLGLLLLLTFFIKKRCAKRNLKLSCLCPVFPHANIPMWTIYTLFF